MLNQSRLLPIIGLAALVAGVASVSAAVADPAEKTLSRQFSLPKPEEINRTPLPKRDGPEFRSRKLYEALISAGASQAYAIKVLGDLHLPTDWVVPSKPANAVEVPKMAPAEETLSQPSTSPPSLPMEEGQVPGVRDVGVKDGGKEMLPPQVTPSTPEASVPPQGQ